MAASGNTGGGQQAAPVGEPQKAPAAGKEPAAKKEEAKVAPAKPQPPPAAQKPAANPGTKGTPSNQPCVECQKAAQAACDVDTLELTATPEPTGDPRTIKADQKLRAWVTAEDRKAYPEHILKYLEDFDIILDCTAGFKDGYLKTAKTGGAPNIENLTAKATFHRAGKCPTGEHPKVSAKVLAGTPERIIWEPAKDKSPGKTGGAPKKPSSVVDGRIDAWAGDSYTLDKAEVPWPLDEARRFYAEPIFANAAKESNDFMFIFYFIFVLMQRNKPKLVQVIADGHGKRADGKPVRQSLRGLYRIFREDQISFVFAYKGPGRQALEDPPDPGVKADPKAGALAAHATQAQALAPAVKSFWAEAKEAITPTAKKKGFVEVIRGQKRTEPGVSIQVLLNEETLTINEEKLGQWKELFALVQKLQVPNLKPLAPVAPSKKPAGFENFDGGLVSLGLCFSLIWTISVHSLQKKIIEVLTLLKNCVKYGLWMELDFAWFDGNIGFKYATKEGKTYPRYKAIVYGWSIYQELSLINLQVTLKFGVQATFGASTGVWAYVYAGCAFKVTASVEVSLDSDNVGNEKKEIACEPEFSAGVSGGATLLGMGLTICAEVRAKWTYKYTQEFIFAENKSKVETLVALNPIVVEYRANLHIPAFSKRGVNGQWYPWGPTRTVLWNAKAPP